MTRVAHDVRAVRLDVAPVTAAPSLLGGLDDTRPAPPATRDQRNRVASAGPAALFRGAPARCGCTGRSSLACSTRSLADRLVFPTPDRRHPEKGSLGYAPQR